MPHIALPTDLPGISSAMAFRPETAVHLRALAETLLRGPNSLTSAERESDCRVRVVAQRLHILLLEPPRGAAHHTAATTRSSTP